MLKLLVTASVESPAVVAVRALAVLVATGAKKMAESHTPAADCAAVAFADVVVDVVLMMEE